MDLALNYAKFGPGLGQENLKDLIYLKRAFHGFLLRPESKHVKATSIRLFGIANPSYIINTFLLKGL